MDNINIPVPPDYSGSNLAGYWHNRILAEVYSLNRKCPIFIKDFQGLYTGKNLYIDEVINLDINYVLSFVSGFLEKNGFLEKDIQKGQVFTSEMLHAIQILTPEGNLNIKVNPIDFCLRMLKFSQQLQNQLPVAIYDMLQKSFLNLYNAESLTDKYLIVRELNIGLSLFEPQSPSEKVLKKACIDILEASQVFQNTLPSAGSLNNQSFGSKGFRPDPGEIGDLAGSAIGGVGGGPVGIFVGGFFGTWLGNSLSYAWQNSTL